MQLTLWTSLAFAFATVSAAAAVDPTFPIVPTCNDGEEPYPVQRFAQCESYLSAMYDLLLTSKSFISGGGFSWHGPTSCCEHSNRGSVSKLTFHRLWRTLRLLQPVYVRYVPYQICTSLTTPQIGQAAFHAPFLRTRNRSNARPVSQS